MTITQEIIAQITKRLQELAPRLDGDPSLAKLDITIGINTRAGRVHHVHVSPQHTYPAIDTRGPA